MTAPIDAWEMRMVLGWPELCSEEVSRRGNAEPCEKTAVAVRIDEVNEGGYYPVCSRHARAPMLSLESIVRFLLDRHEAQGVIAAGLMRMASEEMPLSGSQRPTEPQTPVPASERVSDTVNAAHSPKIVLMSEPDRSTT